MTFRNQMTPQQIVAIGIRFFAVYIVFQSLEYLVTIPNSMENTNLNSKAYLAYGIGSFGVLAALFCWFFPLSIANRIVPRTRFENHLNLQAFEAVRAGGSLIGLWLFATALPSILWFFFSIAANAGPNQSIFGALDTESKIRIAFHVVQLVLAYVLIFKSHLFAALATEQIETPKDQND
jgi:hypothetical protein